MEPDCLRLPSLGPSHFIRSKGVPRFHYIDDCHVGQLRLATTNPTWSDLDLAKAGIFIAALVLVSCGYFIGLKKSVFIPVQAITFLSFISDSVKWAFLLPKEKKQKFADLRDSIMTVAVKTLQRFAGEAVSFLLAVPAAKLFTREVNRHIGKGLKNSRPVKMTEALMEELKSWKFLDSSDGFLPWKCEKHLTLKISSDASNFGQGGILYVSNAPMQTRDYWTQEELEGKGVAVKEATDARN